MALIKKRRNKSEPEESKDEKPVVDLSKSEDSDGPADIAVAEEHDGTSMSAAVEDEWNRVDRDRDEYIRSKEEEEAKAAAAKKERERRKAIQLMNQRSRLHAERNATIRMNQLLASMPEYVKVMKRVPLDAPATDGFSGAMKRALKGEGKISKEELEYRQGLISRHNSAVNRVRALNEAGLGERNIIFSTRIPGVGYESHGFSRILVTSILEDMILGKHGFVLLVDGSDINQYDFHREGNGLTERIFDRLRVHIGFMDAIQRWRAIEEGEGSLTMFCTKVAPAKGRSSGKSQSYWFMPGHVRVNPNDLSVRYLSDSLIDGIVSTISSKVGAAVIDVSPEKPPANPKAVSFYPTAFGSPNANYMVVEIPIKYVDETFTDKLSAFLDDVAATGFDTDRMSFVIIPDGKIDDYMKPLMRMVASDIVAAGYPQDRVTLINDNGSPAGIGTALPKTAEMVRKMVDTIYGITYNDDPPVV